MTLEVKIMLVDRTRVVQLDKPRNRRWAQKSVTMMSVPHVGDKLELNLDREPRAPDNHDFVMEADVISIEHSLVLVGPQGRCRGHEVTVICNTELDECDLGWLAESGWEVY